MTKYATNNPIGSMDPKDLFDNAQNLDYALNEITQGIWKDRFGRNRKSFWGMEQDFSAQLLSQKQRFDNFIQSSGYEVIGEYASGPLTIDEYNQLIRYQNELWKLTAATNLPFTTSGNDAASWINDSTHFLSVGDNALRQQISDPHGAIKYPELQIARWRDDGDVRAWGAKGDNATDDTQAFLDAIAYCVANRKTVYVPSGRYRTSAELVLSGDASMYCESGVIFQNIDTTNKTFPFITISGGSKRVVLGYIDGYKEGIAIKGSTKNINFTIINRCISGVVLRAERVNGANFSNLDNIVTGTHISGGENGIVFEQNYSDLVQQGNEIRVNFCSSTKHCVVWDDLGTHTSSSNWDSNFVELQAVDPSHIAGASICNNKTKYSVLVNTVNVVKWAGGWTDSSEMILLRGGSFDACEFNFSLAQSVTMDMVCEPNQRSSFGITQIRPTRHGNTGTSSPPVCVDQGNIASFNGGVPMHQGVFKIRVAIPDLAPGAVHVAYFTHAFCVSANSSKFQVRQVRGGANGVSVQLRDSATTALGAVRVIITNPTNTQINAGNIDIVITCVG